MVNSNLKTPTVFEKMLKTVFLNSVLLYLFLQTGLCDQNETCGDFKVDTFSLSKGKRLFVSSGERFWVVSNFTNIPVVNPEGNKPYRIKNYCEEMTAVDMAAWFGLNIHSRRCDYDFDNASETQILLIQKKSQPIICILNVNLDGSIWRLLLNNRTMFTNFKHNALESGYQKSPLRTIAYRYFDSRPIHQWDRRFVTTNDAKQVSIWQCITGGWLPTVNKEDIDKYYQSHGKPLSDFKAMSYFKGMHVVATVDGKVYHCPAIDHDSNRIPFNCTFESDDLQRYLKIETEPCVGNENHPLREAKSFPWTVLILFATLLILLVAFVALGLYCIIKKKPQGTKDDSLTV